MLKIDICKDKDEFELIVYRILRYSNHTLYAKSIEFILSIIVENHYSGIRFII